ncbi:MAG: epoxyqueuosine reductase QueH [Dysgonamonadaceae bacterium]|nr:epoxyqueuosine reductase QueH [Dysgonamonadaceae bacterium]
MNGSKIQLQAPDDARQIVLHACCAPCSGAIIECMLDNGLLPTLFYFNPNISPQAEYERRKAECIRHAEALHLPFIDADYDHAGWLKQVEGLETEPERGCRCLACFKIRLAATAQYAHEHGFRVFTTTLAASRWKNLHQINEAGRYAATLFQGLVFWEQNWRKGGLSIRRSELIEQYGFYNQTFCGCEFSRKK